MFNNVVWQWKLVVLWGRYKCLISVNFKQLWVNESPLQTISKVFGTIPSLLIQFATSADARIISNLTIINSTQTQFSTDSYAENNQEGENSPHAPQLFQWWWKARKPKIMHETWLSCPKCWPGTVQHDWRRSLVQELRSLKNISGMSLLSNYKQAPEHKNETDLSQCQQHSAHKLRHRSQVLSPTVNVVKRNKNKII